MRQKTQIRRWRKGSHNKYLSNSEDHYGILWQLIFWYAGKSRRNG
jgi:hypothetical protein